MYFQYLFLQPSQDILVLVKIEKYFLLIRHINKNFVITFSPRKYIDRNSCTSISFFSIIGFILVQHIVAEILGNKKICSTEGENICFIQLINIYYLKNNANILKYVSFV
jgi:hypothetical protein